MIQESINYLTLKSHHHVLISRFICASEQSEFGLKAGIEFVERIHKSVASVNDRVRRSDFPIGLHLNMRIANIIWYFDLDVLFERVRLFVACESYSVVLQQLVSDGIPESVVFVLDS